LEILADHAIVKVLRGRTGGAWLVRPSSVGAVRQSFALFASRHQKPSGLMRSMCALDLIRLRVAESQFAKLSRQSQDAKIAALRGVLKKWQEPRRYFCLYLALEEIADNRFIGAVTNSLIAYVSRLGPSGANYEEIDSHLLGAEKALIDAIQSGDAKKTRQIHFSIYNMIARLHDYPEFFDEYNL
jgi:DNA-binding FadR family transcriptional regulator